MVETDDVWLAGLDLSGRNARGDAFRPEEDNDYFHNHENSHLEWRRQKASVEHFCSGQIIMISLIIKLPGSEVLIIRQCENSFLTVFLASPRPVLL